MLDKNAIRVQQTQRKNKLKKTKALIWKLLKWLVVICRFIYRVWRFFEGEDLG